MKIAVWHNLPSGGAKRALYDHVKGLTSRGHIVEAWCPPTADQTYLPLSDMVEEHIVALNTAPCTRPQEMQRKLTGGLDITDTMRAMHKHSAECACQIRQGNFDVLFANTCQTFAAPAIGRHLNLPKVLYLQEPYRLLYEARPELAWIAPHGPRPSKSLRTARTFYREVRRLQSMRIQAREELTNAQAFDTMLVNSFFSRESILRAYNLNAQVCYLGVDTDLFRGTEPPVREDFVMGIGSFQAGKNIAFVIDAVAAMPAPRPRLVWVGNSNFDGYLQQMQERAQQKDVDFDPHLRATDAEIVALLHRAFAMVYAPRLEPFGFAPLEANACGLPVIAVAEGGVRETVQDGQNGLLVEPDPSAMAAAVETLRNNPTQARRLGTQAQSLVRERWSITASVDRLERHLARAVQEKTA